ncbi:6-phospho-3-hexuloisomerase [Falsibacillus albus]|uniref:6-phospho-3-hexuloisomerase n=1 Tax=Falsibacillus albus TaxID=2478915 RepID=A0A3L7JSH7_9BACI|nr:6-phospho-3-hexuloisomerase [Falsibacillus albus]RLQ93808.1 6-phospho-3-hexuloisomerase [Falsibacillus albus]
MNKVETILTEIQAVTRSMEEEKLHQIAQSLQKAKRIFVIGEGRSGLMGKSFAMRLMHLGAEVFVVGETITPSINGDDLLVAISGSGTTKSVVWTAEKAQSLGCEVIALTTNPDSDLSQQASSVLHIPAATKHRRENELKTIQPLGSLFDQCAHIVFDTICLQYAELNEIDHADAFSKHSNVE